MLGVDVAITRKGMTEGEQSEGAVFAPFFDCKSTVFVIKLHCVEV